MNIHTPTPLFNFDNTYARELEGFYVDWQAEPAKAPSILALNTDLASELELDPVALNTDQALAIFSGNAAPQGAANLAQAYAGHQFGGFTPSLGDGRALMLGEITTPDGRRLDIQLKGSGRTPYSRGGDGKAAVGPVLREYLMSEAMHALGIPTTRALAAVATGEHVYREGPLPGAVLTRVAASHIRVGTFQYFAVRKDWDKVRHLCNYVIARHYPAARDAENPVLAMFDAVLDAQARLIAKWMLVGFIHGVMNTDNMTISGETIDYGPCAFMDRYDPATVFSSIDTQGRYAYGNQPAIAQWNLARFAETLITAVDDDQATAIEKLTERLNTFPQVYVAHWLDGMRSKIGLQTTEDGDIDLVNDLYGAIEAQDVDFTLFFRRLATSLRSENTDSVRELFTDSTKFDDWQIKWHERRSREKASPQEAATAMDAVNPLYIPRNHQVESALTAAVEQNDLTRFNTLLEIVRAPFTERDGLDDYTMPAPTDAPAHRTFCGT